jgi:hypothetical protein
VPVHYLYRASPRERLLAYYRLADACLVTPLADGMNLVAKEFVTAQAAGHGAGALVLSEFTGAATELRDALRCNPSTSRGSPARSMTPSSSTRTSGGAVWSVWLQRWLATTSTGGQTRSSQSPARRVRRHR